MKKVKQYLDHAIRKRKKVQEMVLEGDLNFPGVQWDQRLTRSPIGQLFVDTFSDVPLHQLVVDPTHYKRNILDLILTDKPEKIAGVIVDDKHGICGSDHYGITFQLKLNAKRKNQ